MKTLSVKSCILTDRNGNKRILRRPFLGSLICREENGRLKIIRRSWWRKRILLPAIEDRIELDCKQG